ncbi:hypothetical protein KFL_010120025 [Klebsormidium nitens]|uniref:Uncharacterized protein n=1 Tax=Klebsormidium nitens TaxID=105231 RepID=A0A1Y1INV5_KLENI|nr:hypothetical protein KFL_010120025 [Klebsormidium nitens]|eukprot:GAQ92424.1 hypothetical protein KFL_010120025 [Klebsormidium nitens]
MLCVPAVPANRIAISHSLLRVPNRVLTSSGKTFGCVSPTATPSDIGSMGRTVNVEKRPGAVEICAYMWTDRVTYEYKHYSFELSVVTNVKGAGEDREEARDSFDETPGDDGSAIYEVEIELKPDRDGFPKKSRSHARILAESLVLKMLDLVYFVEDVDCRSIAFRSSSGRDRQKAKPPGAT